MRTMVHGSLSITQLAVATPSFIICNHHRHHSCHVTTPKQALRSLPRAQARASCQNRGNMDTWQAADVDDGAGLAPALPMTGLQRDTCHAATIPEGSCPGGPLGIRPPHLHNGMLALGQWNATTEWRDLYTLPSRLVRDVGFVMACPELLHTSDEWGEASSGAGRVPAGGRPSRGCVPSTRPPWRPGLRAGAAATASETISQTAWSLR